MLQTHMLKFGIYMCRILGMNNGVLSAIAYFGSASALARRLGCSVQAVCFYRDGEREIPPKTCTSIEKLTNGFVSRRDLRPNDFADVWPELAEQEVP